jgi:hypothetical protein
MAVGGGAGGGREWKNAILPLVMLAIGATMACLGGRTVLATRHSRARIESTCTVYERHFVTGRFGARALDREQIRLRLEVDGARYTTDWLLFQGGRPDPDAPVVCFYDPRHPEDIALDRDSYGTEITVTLYGTLFAGLALWLVVVSVGDGREGRARRPWHWMTRLHGLWRKAPAPPPAGDDPYREAEPHSPGPDGDVQSPLPPLDTVPGGTLSVRLGGDPVFGRTKALKVAGLGCMSVPMVFLFALLISDHYPVIGVLCWALHLGVLTIPFVVDGAATRRDRRSLPLLEVDREPAVLGSKMEVYVELFGPAEIDRLYVDVECDLSKARGDPAISGVPVEPLEGRRFLARDQTYSNRWTVSLPPGAPATSVGARWSVLVRWSVAGRDRAGRYAFRTVAKA